jgi:hypothetical protein
MNSTSIQWAHSTVNPVMGCLGCELFPKPEAVLAAIDQAIGSLVPGPLRYLDRSVLVAA